MKIIILAAGRGSRMHTDQIHKGLLPFRGKAVISHTIDQFPDHEFVIAVHHLKDQVMDYMRLAHPNVKVTYVDVGSIDTPCAGPGFSLMQALDVAREESLVVTCDTYFKLPPATPYFCNWIGVADIIPAEAVSYCNVRVEDGGVKELYDKVINPRATHMWTGLMYIHHWKVALQNLYSRLPHEMEMQCSDAWLGMDLIPVGHEWIDLGTKSRYINALEADGYDYSKPHECTYVLEDRVIKFFSNQDRKKTRSLRQASELSGVTPKEIVDASKHFAAYEKAPGKTFYEVGTPELFKSFLSWMRANVWKPIDYSQIQEDALRFYWHKTDERVRDYLKSEPHLDFDKVNGVPIKYGWDKMIRMVNWGEFVKDSRCVGFHGDLNFDNIIVNEGAFTLIDWRDTFGGCAIGGDLYYEYAKLLSGITFDFDLIKKGDFRIIDSHGNAVITFARRTVNDQYEDILMRDAVEQGLDWEKIDFLRWMILAGMSGLHKAPYSTALFYYSLGQANLSLHMNYAFLNQDYRCDS